MTIRAFCLLTGAVPVLAGGCRKDACKRGEHD